jgi:hypothetical protein
MAPKNESRTAQKALELTEKFSAVKFGDTALSTRVAANGDVKLTMKQADWAETMTQHGVTEEVRDTVVKMVEEVGRESIEVVDSVIEEAYDVRKKIIAEAAAAVKDGTANVTEHRLAEADPRNVTVRMALGSGPLSMATEITGRSEHTTHLGDEPKTTVNYGKIDVGLNMPVPKCLTDTESEESIAFKTAAHCRSIFGGK